MKEKLHTLKLEYGCEKDIARVYAEKYVDEHFLNNSYVEVRNPKEKLFECKETMARLDKEAKEKLKKFISGRIYYMNLHILLNLN